MTISQADDVQHDPVSDAQHATRKNSPLAYCFGALELRAAGQAIGGRYQFYYANVLKLAATLAVAINIVYAFWDIASHPLFRFLSGNTRTRWGRRRPWLLGGLPFRVVFLVLPYAVPQSFRQGGAYAD